MASGRGARSDSGARDEPRSTTIWNSRSHCWMLRPRVSQYMSIGSPSTYSMTMYGRAVGGRAAVEQARDVRMIERRQDLAFELQPALHMSRQGPASDQLDRDLLLELLVGAIREEDLAHAATPETAHDAIRADPLAGEVDCGVFLALRCRGVVLAEPLLPRLELVHRVGVQIAIGRASLADETQPLVRRQRLRLIEDLLQRLGRHCAILKRGAPPVLRSA